MTKVFVSYSRKDKARVEPIVAFIESVAEEVWWDDRLVAGESFTEETEKRLEESDFVVVVWSPHSARSKWVFDEAAVGRDAGKLLPLSIDGQTPPLGFRHVHTTDFSDWNGDRDDKCALALCAALKREKLSGPVAKIAPAAKPAPQSRFWSRPTIIVAFAAAAVAAILAFAFAPRLAAPPAGTIAVLPFADLSPNSDKAYFADGVAEEILTAIARNTSLKVIGRTSAAKFRAADADISTIRRALNVEHVLEGSVRAAEGRIKVTVALLRTRDGIRVWSEEYDRPDSDIFTIENEVGAAVADRIGGAAPSELPAASASIDALDLLFEARQLIRSRDPLQMSKARELLELALTIDPASAAIYGALAEATFFDASWSFGTNADKRLKAARTYADKAIALDPNRADGFAALALILSESPEARQPIIEKAIALDPSRSDLRMWLTQYLESQEKQLENLRTVIALDPLWHVPVRNLASSLSKFGRYEEALRVIDDYAVRAPDDTINPAIFRAELAESRGDLAEAFISLNIIQKRNDQIAFELARLLAILGFDDDARALIPTCRLPPECWARRDAEGIFTKTNAVPIFTTGFPYEVLAEFNRPTEILKLFDGKLASAEKFCANLGTYGVVNGAPSLVWALQENNRWDESASLSACVSGWLQNQIGAGDNAPYHQFYLAQLAALDGRPKDAVDLLKKAVDANYIGQTYSLNWREYRAFEKLADEPGFSALQRRVEAEAERQRERVDQALKKGGKTPPNPG